jgi:predicted Zn-dependent peptidase
MSVRVTKLPNGIHVITDAMDTVETASVGAWVGIGARHERPELNGVCHMIEHMVFKGTKRRSPQAIVEEIEAVGGQINAYTSRENTAYFAKVLKEDVPLALDIVADIVQHATFDAQELERERLVILQEISQANDTPDDIIFDYFNEAAYPGQSVGRPVLGSTEIIETIPRAAILDYMHAEYAAPRIVVGAAGRVDHDRFVAMAAEAFTALPKAGPAAAGRPRYQPNERREPRALEQVHLITGFEGVSYGDPDYHALAVYSMLLGGGMSSRLFQEAREKRGLVYSIYSFAQSYDDGGLFGIYAGTGERETDELVPLIAEEMAKVCDAVGAEEVSRARAQLKASIVMSLESTSARAEQAARQFQIYGRPIPVAETISQIEAVDEAAVRRVARRVLASPLTLAAVGPIKKLESYDKIAGRFAAN